MRAGASDRRGTRSAVGQPADPGRRLPGGGGELGYRNPAADGGGLSPFPGGSEPAGLREVVLIWNSPMGSHAYNLASSCDSSRELPWRAGGGPGNRERPSLRRRGSSPAAVCSAQRSVRAASSRRRCSVPALMGRRRSWRAGGATSGSPSEPGGDRPIAGPGVGIADRGIHRLRQRHRAGRQPGGLPPVGWTLVLCGLV